MEHGCACRAEPGDQGGPACRRLMVLQLLLSLAHGLDALVPLLIGGHCDEGCDGALDARRAPPGTQQGAGESQEGVLPAAAPRPVPRQEGYGSQSAGGTLQVGECDVSGAAEGIP